ncbi:MAG: hypothetical protein ACRDL6_00735 [Solirubrobacterales bacterium]
MKAHGIATAVLAALACALLPSAAAAQTDSRQAAELTFHETDPGASTGFTLKIDYVNPSDPSAKPPAVRRVVQRFAEGTRIDTSVPELCGATDAQLMLQGPEACPAGSQVGSGTVSVDTGLPEPGRFIVADTVFLNNTDELILVSTDRGTGARVVTRAAVEQDRIVTELTPLPGTPPDGGAIDVVDFRIEEVSRVVGGEERGYVTTPATCPTGGWLNSISFTYADGVTQTTSNGSPCSPTTLAGGPPARVTGPAVGRGGGAKAKRCKRKGRKKGQKRASVAKKKGRKCKEKKGRKKKGKKKR